MSAFHLWTWVAIGVLVVLPPVIFAAFLRDAVRMFRDLGPPAGDEEGDGRGGTPPPRG